MPVVIPDSIIDDLLKNVLLNLPEYSISFRCLKFDYEKHVYQLYDAEEGRLHTITLPIVHKAFERMMRGRLSRVPRRDEYFGLDVFDPGEWDAPMLDGLLQEAVTMLDEKNWE